VDHHLHVLPELAVIQVAQVLELNQPGDRVTNGYSLSFWHESFTSNAAACMGGAL